MMLCDLPWQAGGGAQGATGCYVEIAPADSSGKLHGKLPGGLTGADVRWHCSLLPVGQRRTCNTGVQIMKDKTESHYC